jgi:uncharacterized protein YndB with AHSA1/START domain
MSDPMPDEGVISASSDAEGIRIVRIFEAPRELVFRAWTEREGFAAWFGEPGSTIPLETFSMDARPGGAWSLVMLHGPDRTELPFSGAFVEVVEPERVVMTLAAPEGPAGPASEMLTADLEDLGDGRTRMTFTQRGGNLSPNEYSRALRGELIFFDRLGEHLAASLKARHDPDRDIGDEREPR